MPPRKTSLTPTVVTGWLECDHSLALRLLGESGSFTGGKFATLVTAKGVEHEEERLRAYQAEGTSTLDLAGDRDTPFSERASNARGVLPVTEADLIYQLPLEHGGMRGIADFAIRVVPRPGFSEWEPVDAKLARNEGKPGHVLQLCFYAEAIEAITGAPPENMHLSLGSKQIETFKVAEFAPYWRRIRRQLGALLDEDAEKLATTPEPCSFCDYCDFAETCEQRWRSEDSLVYVANISKTERAALEGLGITTMEALVGCDEAALVATDPRLLRRQVQARLQKEAEEVAPDGRPPFQRIQADEEDPHASWGRGMANLPQPDEGDVFFDIEGHPLWTSEEGLIFLFGILLNDRDGWIYRDPPLWAHDRAQELAQAKELIDFLSCRRDRHPGMHVYHYNHTERTVLERIVRGTSHEEALDDLVASGLFVDLHLDVLRDSFQVGVESYGLKQIERLVGFERTTSITGGAGAVVDYERYIKDHEDRWLTNIARYNEDDVRATLAVRDWLIEQRDENDIWRDAVLEPDQDQNERPAADLVEQLLTFPDDAPERLLADLLHYWHREYLAYHAKKILELSGDPGGLLGSSKSFGMLEFTEIEDGSEEGLIRISFRWPEQDISRVASARGWHVLVDEKLRTFWGLQLDPEQRTGSFEAMAETATPLLSPAIASESWYSTKQLLAALSDVARLFLGIPTELPVREPAVQMLCHEPSRFSPTYAPPTKGFSDKVDDIVEAALELDRSYLIVQGPPGTGKTYTGAEIALHLARAGKSVGITATGHKAVENLFDETVDEGAGHLRPGDGGIKMGRYQSRAEEDVTSRVSLHGKSAASMFRSVQKVKVRKYDISGGALRFFVGNQNREIGLDYLIIDEAGQVSLADAIAIAACATNVILLGDPQQLPHVAQATHPEGAGASVLRHLIGDGVAVVPGDRGIFLHTSYRMHPSVCSFISDTFYESQLRAAEDCSRIQLGGSGVGLSWVPMTHEGRSTSSIEEAARTHELILELLGQEFIDRDGNVTTLEARPEHFMIVVPFNDQKRVVRDVLASDPRTEGLAQSVGTVDKFQGRQAAVVIYSMTCSSGLDAPRGVGFLFSRERFNVALSRAKAHAFVLCTQDLLDTHAKTVDQMRMISAIDAFVERSAIPQVG